MCIRWYTWWLTHLNKGEVFTLEKEVKQGRLLHNSVGPASGPGPTANPAGVLTWRLVKAPGGASDRPGSNGQASDSGTSRCKFWQASNPVERWCRIGRVHCSSRGVCEAHTGVTRGSVGLTLESDVGCWTGVWSVWCSLDFSGLRRTLPGWSPTVRSRRRSDGSINAWQWNRWRQWSFSFERGDVATRVWLR
jgi:hypothetical protein